jgi:DNA-binding transcriptional LysR family regulator
LDNRIDIAVVEGNFSSTYIHDEPLGNDRLVLILPKRHPLLDQAEIVLRDITRYPLLLRENGSAGRTFLNAVFSSHQIDFEPTWESTSTQALVKAVSCGLGLSILPEQLVVRDIAAGAVATRPVADEAFIRSNHIVWHRQKYLTRTAKRFIDLCLKADPRWQFPEA